MNNKHSYEVQLLFESSFRQRLAEVEAARKDKVKNQMIFRGLIIGAKVTIAILGLITLVGTLGGITMLLLSPSLKALIDLIVFLGIYTAIIGGLVYGIQRANARIDFFEMKHYNLLFNLRKNAIEQFIKIIFPNAQQISFNPTRYKNLTMKSVMSRIFYDSFYNYEEKNLLTFSVENKQIIITEVKSAWTISSNKEAIEIDKFISKSSQQVICEFHGIVYQGEFHKANINDNLVIFLIPKKAAPSSMILSLNKLPFLPTIPPQLNPYLSFLGHPMFTSFSQNYNKFKLYKRDRRSPIRFLERGFEEYSVENVDMEDYFYAFTNNEQDSRKLLSYKFMEKIVKVSSTIGTIHQGNSNTLWMQFENIKRHNSKPLQLLTVLNAQKNLTFFELTGAKSCELNNFKKNFQALEDIVVPGITDLLG